MNMNKENVVYKFKGIRVLETGDYQIGDLLFKIERLCLYKGQKEIIDLNYQQAQILKMFLEAEDHFLHKEKAIERLWPNLYTNDATISSNLHNRFNMCIARLRKALSVDNDIEVLCRTKKGYQLIVKDQTI